MFLKKVMLLKEVSYAHQAKLFYMSLIILIYFQHYYSSLQCHMILQKSNIQHSNMLICCSKNISYYYQY